MMGRTTKAQYAKHYAEFQSRPEEISRRSERNKAHAKIEKKVGSAALKGKDVSHKNPIRSGGSNAPANLAVQSKHFNRGWKAGGKNR